MNIKKYAPIMMLYARSIMPGFLLLLALMAAAEGILFALIMDPALWLDASIQKLRLHMIFPVFFVLLTLLLTQPGLGQAKYLLGRLPVTTFEQAVCRFLFNTSCYVILGIFQLVLVFCFALWFGAVTGPGIFGPQSLPLLFYRNDFLHSLLPLADLPRLLRPVSFAVVMGSASAYPDLHRLKKPLAGYLLTAGTAFAVILFFPAPPGQYMADLILAFAALTLAGILLCWQHVEAEEVPYDKV